jgi:DNA-binding response OmpR family regulator
MHGYDVLKKLRVAKVQTPVLILSGISEMDSKVRSFGFGADDYVTKPFHREELIARIHAVVRRSKGHSQSVIRTGKLSSTSTPRRSKWMRPRPSDRQGICDAGAAFAAQGHHADQGNVPQPPVWRYGRA